MANDKTRSKRGPRWERVKSFLLPEGMWQQPDPKKRSDRSTEQMKIKLGNFASFHVFLSLVIQSAALHVLVNSFKLEQYTCGPIKGTRHGTHQHNLPGAKMLWGHAHLTHITCTPVFTPLVHSFAECIIASSRPIATTARRSKHS